MNTTKEESAEKLTWRELGVQQAFREAGRLAIEAWRYVAYCKASVNPEVRALAEHYVVIAETWSLHAGRILAANEQGSGDVNHEGAGPATDDLGDAP